MPAAMAAAVPAAAVAVSAAAVGVSEGRSDGLWGEGVARKSARAGWGVWI